MKLALQNMKKKYARKRNQREYLVKANNCEIVLMRVGWDFHIYRNLKCRDWWRDGWRIFYDFCLNVDTLTILYMLFWYLYLFAFIKSFSMHQRIFTMPFTEQQHQEENVWSIFAKLIYGSYDCNCTN